MCYLVAHDKIQPACGYDESSIGDLQRTFILSNIHNETTNDWFWPRSRQNPQQNIFSNICFICYPSCDIGNYRCGSGDNCDNNGDFGTVNGDDYVGNDGNDNDVDYGFEECVPFDP